MGRASTEVQQRRRNPGLAEVQYSNTQPIVDAVCGYVLVVNTCPTAVNKDHTAT